MDKGQLLKLKNDLKQARLQQLTDQQQLKGLKIARDKLKVTINAELKEKYDAAADKSEVSDLSNETKRKIVAERDSRLGDVLLQIVELEEKITRQLIDIDDMHLEIRIYTSNIL